MAQNTIIPSNVKLQHYINAEKQTPSPTSLNYSLA